MSAEEQRPSTPEKKRKSPPATLAKLGHSDEEYLFCAATGLPLRQAFFLDRGTDTWPVCSPFVGALMIHNLTEYIRSPGFDDIPEGREPPSQKQLVIMWNRLCKVGPMVDKSLTPCNFSPQPFLERCAAVKGNMGMQRKFTDELKKALEKAPFVYKASSGDPFLPFHFSCESFDPTVPETAAKVAELLKIGNAFEKEWGWRCVDLLKTAEQIREKRKRHPRLYYVEKKEGGKTDLFTFPKLEEAYEKATSLMEGRTFDVRVSVNPREITVNGYKKDDAYQEIQWRRGQVIIQIFRDKELLKKAFELEV
jgi:hypothetical protein